MDTPRNRHKAAHAGLYAAMSDETRASVDAALASDQLENGEAPEEYVALVVRSVTEDMSDDVYLAAVMAQLNTPTAQD